MNESIQSRPVDAIFPHRRPAMKAGDCPTCGGPAVDFRDQISIRESQISGCCQSCQDSVFGV